MTNRNKLKNIIDDDFDKNNNYNDILKRIEGNNSMKIYGYIFIFTCLILIISVLLFSNFNNDKTVILEEPIVEDNIIFNDGGYKGAYDSIAAKPVYTSVKSKFSFFDNLAVPEGFVISNEMEVYVPASENDHNMSKLWEYSLEYCVFNSDKTECLNSFGILFTKEEQILGMGLWARDLSKYKKSTINGHEVTLYGSDDVSGKEAFFEYDGYKFYVASTHLTKEEFINLIKSIIEQKSFNYVVLIV